MSCFYCLCGLYDKVRKFEEVHSQELAHIVESDSWFNGSLISCTFPLWHSFSSFASLQGTWPSAVLGTHTHAHTHKTHILTFKYWNTKGANECQAQTPTSSHSWKCDDHIIAVCIPSSPSVFTSVCKKSMCVCVCHYPPLWSLCERWCLVCVCVCVQVRGMR